MFNPKYQHRSSIRLRKYDYTEPNWYYITICTHDRENIFGKIQRSKMILNEFGKIVDEEWLKTKEIRKNIDLDYYVIMPNHLHGIIIIEQSIEKGRGELNSPTGDKSGRIQCAPTEHNFQSPSCTTKNVGATRWVARLDCREQLMGRVIACIAVLLSITGAAGAAETDLWEQLVGVTLEYVKGHGPDSSVAEFVGVAHAVNQCDRPPQAARD